MYSEDQFVPIIQSIINLIISVILAKNIGLIGVFIGTLVSGLLPSFYRPYLVYKKVFEKRLSEYYLNYFKNILIIIIIIAIISLINITIIGLPIYIKFVLNMLLCVFVTNGILWLFYRRTDEYKVIKNIGRNLWNKLMIRGK